MSKRKGQQMTARLAKIEMIRTQIAEGAFSPMWRAAVAKDALRYEAMTDAEYDAYTAEQATLRVAMVSKMTTKLVGKVRK